MSVAPGLLSEAAPVAVRVFLGQSPTLRVEQLLVRQMQTVHAWYASRPRPNEQGAQYVSLDAAAGETETLLRYCHVNYVRRTLHHELLEKQLNILDAGKPPKEAPAGVLQALTEVNSTIAGRLNYEERRMRAAKERAHIPFRRELDPLSEFERWDVLTMMRCVAEDDTSVDAEAKAKAFLPTARLDEALHTALGQLLGAPVTPLDKRWAKLLAKNCPQDYEKQGKLPTLRPLDVTARARVIGEKCAAQAGAASGAAAGGGVMLPLLWGHVLRRYATHAAFLRQSSAYWATAAGLTADVEDTAMPLPIAHDVCRQQRAFPAHRFRAQYLYTSVDHTKQAWRSDSFIPLPRLLAHMGESASLDLAAATLVDAWWENAVAPLGDDVNLLDDGVVRAARAFVNETARLYTENPDVLLTRVVESAAAAVPPVTDAEMKWAPEPTTAAESSEGQAAAPSDAELAAEQAAAEVSVADAEHVEKPREDPAAA